MAFVRQQAARGNKSAIADLASMTTPDNHVMWQAFQFLNKTRHIDYKSSKPFRHPISLSEIDSYCTLANIVQPGQKMRLAACILAVDDEYRLWLSKHE
jgi:hypothetical protein